MGQYAYLKVNDLNIHEDGMDYPSVLELFMYSDEIRGIKEIQVNGKIKTIKTLEYVVTCKVVKEILNAQGISLKAAKEEYEKRRAENLNDLRTHVKNLKNRRNVKTKKLINSLEKLNFESWLTAFKIIIEQKLWKRSELSTLEFDKQTMDNLKVIISEDELDDYWHPFNDLRYHIRCICECINNDDKITYDVSEYIFELDNKDLQLADWCRDTIKSAHAINQKIIILTEGSTDRNTIKDSLEILYPHLFDLYSFMEYENSRVPGGATMLVSIVKSFIGAGISNRVIALFDNDTAACAELIPLKEITIPSNFKVIQYPYLQVAKNYPTQGPQGIICMDINKLACSVEMYFGRDVLTQKNNSLTPVQWKGYNQKLNAYQGEVLNKVELLKKFKNKINDCKKDPAKIDKYDWTGMEAILNLIINAFNE